MLQSSVSKEHEACCCSLPSHSIIQPSIRSVPFTLASTISSTPIRTPSIHPRLGYPSRQLQKTTSAAPLLQRHHTHNSSQHHGGPDVCLLRPCSACERTTTTTTTTTIDPRGRLRARRRRQYRPYPCPCCGTACAITSTVVTVIIGGGIERIRGRGIRELGTVSCGGRGGGVEDGDGKGR